MSNYRRFIAALLGVFLLQLALPLGASGCSMHHGAAATVQAAGHDMSEMAGCGIPSAPGQCETMTTCAIAALPSLALRVQQPDAVAVAGVAEPAAADSRLASPPELPPPRA